jgi:hypothetical protein
MNISFGTACFPHRVPVRFSRWGWIVTRAVGVGGLFSCVGYPLPSVIEEKGEGFENGKIFGFCGLAFNLKSALHH